MLGFLKKPALLVEEGRVVDHQLVFQLHQQVGSGTVGDQVITAGQGQLPGIVGLQLNHLDPRAEEVQHLSQLVFAIRAHTDLQLEWRQIGWSMVDPLLMDIENSDLSLALQPEQTVQATVQGQGTLKLTSCSQ